MPVDLLAAGTAPPVLPSIGGLIYPGLRHQLLGEPESLKSWIALLLTVEQILAGHTVFYLDFESTPRDMLARLRDLGLDDQEIAAGFVYLQPDEPIGTGAAAADLAALVAARRPTLVTVDAMIGALSLHGLDPKSDKDIETFHRVLIDPLMEHGAASLILDHVIKNREERGRWATGSERKIGRVDVALLVEIVHPFGRGRTGTARISTSKDRPGYLARPRAADLELSSDTVTGQITWTLTTATPGAEPAPFRPTFLMERASRYLEIQVEPVSRRHVEEHVQGKATAIRTALDILTAEHYITANDGPGRTKLLHSSRPYREADDAPASPASPCVPDASRTHPNEGASRASHPLLRGRTRDAHEDTPAEELNWA